MSQDRDYHSPKVDKLLGWTYCLLFLSGILPSLQAFQSFNGPPVNMLSAGIAFTHTGKQVRLPSTTYILEQSITLHQVEQSGQELLELHKSTAQKFDNISDVITSKIPQGPGIRSLPLNLAVQEFISRLSILGKAEMNKDAAYSKALTQTLITKLMKTQGNLIPPYEEDILIPNKVKTPPTPPSSHPGFNASFVKLFASKERQKRGLPMLRAFKSLSRLFTKIPVKKVFPSKAVLPVLLATTVAAEVTGLALHAHQQYGMKVMPVSTPSITELFSETNQNTTFLSRVDRLSASTTDFTLQDYYEQFLDIISPSKSSEAIVPSDLASVPIFHPGNFLDTSKVMANLEYQNKGDPKQFQELGRWRQNWSTLNDNHLEAFTDLQLSIATMATEFIEGWTFMKAITKQHNDLVQYYLDIIDHCDQDFSIKNSNVFLRAWSLLQQDNQLRPSQIAAFNKQLHLVHPKILFLQDEYKIHYVFHGMPENELFDLHLSRTVPFHSNMGTFRIDLEPYMQLKNTFNQLTYIRPASFLSSCSLHEDTYYCDPENLAHDNTDKCIKAALTADLDLLLDHCHIFQTTTNADIFPLAPGVIYYDEIVEIDYSCGTMSITHVYDDTGLFYINPDCTARIDDLFFTNSEGSAQYPDRNKKIPPVEFTTSQILNHPHIFHFSDFNWTIFGLSWKAILLIQGLILANLLLYHLFSLYDCKPFQECGHKLYNIFRPGSDKARLIPQNPYTTELRRLDRFPGPSPYSSDEDDPHPNDRRPIIRAQTCSNLADPQVAPRNNQPFRPPRQIHPFQPSTSDSSSRQTAPTRIPPECLHPDQPTLTARDIRIAHLKRLDILSRSATPDKNNNHQPQHHVGLPITHPSAPRQTHQQLPRNHPAHRTHDVNSPHPST